MAWTPQETFLGFARALRAAGLPISPDRERLFLVAVAETGVERRDQVYWAGRATLTTSPDDIGTFDMTFVGWFTDAPNDARAQDQLSPPYSDRSPLLDSEDEASGESKDEEVLQLTASATEVLRRRDIGAMSPGERAALRRLFATLTPRPPTRRVRRQSPSHNGLIDGPATLREQRRRMGEVAPIRYRRRRQRSRRVVLLLDVSGSMSSYADANLRLAHLMVQSAPRTTEVFTMGTRLSRVTRALHHRDVEKALPAAGDAVPDWSGGTRLGEILAAFLDRWGRRGMARQAVVVVFSDGWERQGPDLLAEQMRRLHLTAHRVIWVNPHGGKAGYEPIQQGIVAALRYVDDFLAGHSIAAYAELLQYVRQA